VTGTEFTMLPTPAAKILGIDARTLTRRADMGCIPYALTKAGHRRFRPDDVEYIAETREWPLAGTYRDGRQAVPQTAGGKQ